MPGRCTLLVPRAPPARLAQAGLDDRSLHEVKPHGCSIFGRYLTQPATMCYMVPSESETRLLSQMRRGTLEYCVLAVLKKGERYTFDLVKTMAAVDGMVTSEGTLYPLLTRLRKDGLVKSSWQESPKGPPRRYYRITPKGARALADFTEEWRRFRSSVDELIEKDE